jgi:hypothetical protein
MVRVMVDAPKYNGRSNNSNSNHHALRHLHRDLINAAHMWTCIAVASGRTSGIEKALEPLETLTAATNERTEFESAQVVSSLALCQFLAHWNGQPQRFAALLKRMPKQKSAVKNFSEPWGLRFFVEAAARHPAWRRDDFAATRREFLTTAFSRPSLAGMFPHIGSWVDSTGRHGLRNDLLSFHPPLPEAFIPAVRSPLIMYYGRSLVARNQPDEAVAAFRQGLMECPPEPEWNHFRGALKYELAAALLRAKQADEAKTVHASIPPAEVAGWLKERHRKLGADLAAAKKK